MLKLTLHLHPFRCPMLRLYAFQSCGAVIIFAPAANGENVLLWPAQNIKWRKASELESQIWIKEDKEFKIKANTEK